MSTPTRVKKPTKRAASPAGSGSAAKKKRPATPQGTASAIPSSVAAVVETETVSSNTPSPVPSESETREVKQVIFKDPTFVLSSKSNATGKRTRICKTLKQIVAAERAMPWKADDVSYGNLDAPPSFKPAKRYSDITGLPAKYTDPMTKVRYATTEEFTRIRMLTSDLVTGYLQLRKATGPVP